MPTLSDLTLHPLTADQVELFYPGNPTPRQLASGGDFEYGPGTLSLYWATTPVTVTVGTWTASLPVGLYILANEGNRVNGWALDPRAYDAALERITRIERAYLESEYGNE